MQSSYCW